MTINLNNFEQSDGSLIYPSGRIITSIEREKLITDSLNTPVRSREKDIKDIIKESSVSILIGETGSGKTTELQQIIHQVYPNDIVITNIPLVSATIGTTSYVSDILCAKYGDPEYILGNNKIGYRTGKGNSSEHRAQITNNTYGLDYLYLSLGNLERQINSTNKNIHIVLDEIHEKGEDFIFYLSKVIELSKKYPGRIKLYGASATVSDDYLNLLVDQFKNISNDVPVTKVEGRTFPIEVIEKNGENHIEEIKKLYEQGKSILIFESGKGEIERTINGLKMQLGDDIDVVPFHSEISKEELEESLKTTGKQKIIVATNAARTGVTLDINSVVDIGKQKTQYYNDLGVPVLVSEDITHDAYMQNRGRAGRKEEGTAVYVGGTEISELKEEAPSSIEKKLDEKKILTELAFGTNILQNELAGNHKYIFNPNMKMLKVSYEWMKQAGLMTIDEKITKYGYDVLRFPLSVFNGRILLEAIENNVAGDIIPMISIIENKGFLTKEFNIKKFGKNVLKREYSDLEVYTKLFEILTSKEVEEDILKMFIGLGIKPGTIDYFRSIKGEEKFYKVLGKELEEVGIKLKNIERIDETVEKIKLYLESNEKYKNSLDLEINDEEKKELIQKSLLSGNLHNIYTSTGKNMFEMWGVNEKNDLEFEQSDTSFLDIGHGDLYIGNPFIIGGSGEKDDKPILSFITSIEPGDIEYFESKEYEEYIVQNNINTGKKQDQILIDLDGDTSVIPKEIIKTEDKQKYLALNWLPYFLVEKNEFFIKYIEQLGTIYNKDELIKTVQKITLGLYKELNYDNDYKEKNTKKFLRDRKILELLLKGNNFNDKSPKQDITKKVFETVEGNGDFFNYIKSINEYNQTLKEAKIYINSNSIDTNLLTDDILDDFIESLEVNTNYTNIILFLKKLNSRKNNNELKKELKTSFASYNKENEKLIELKKRNSWVLSFLSSLKKIKFGDDIIIKELSIGRVDDKKLLLSDPIIKNNNLGKKSTILQKKFKGIKKILNKISLKETEVNNLFISMQKGLFFDNRKFKRGITNLEHFFNFINDKRENNLLEITKLNNNKVSNNATSTNKKIKEINIENTNIDLLISKLTDFKKNILDIRTSIDAINFKDIIFNSDTKNLIYTKKFLYNVLIDIIFEGDFIALDDKQESKLIERLNLNFKDGNIDILQLVELIKNIKTSDLKRQEIDDSKNVVTDGTKGYKGVVRNNVNKGNHIGDSYSRTSYESKLNNYIYDIEKTLVKYKKENQKLELSIKSEHPIVIDLIKNIEGIFSNFYSKDIIELHKNKILNLSKRMYNLSIYNIDEELKKVLISMPLSKSKKIDHNFDLLEEYQDLSEIVLGLYDKDGLKEKDDIDFVGELSGLSIEINSIKEKTRKIKEIVNKI